MGIEVTLTIGFFLLGICLGCLVGLIYVRRIIEKWGATIEKFESSTKYYQKFIMKEDEIWKKSLEILPSDMRVDLLLYRAKLLFEDLSKIEEDE